MEELSAMVEARGADTCIACTSSFALLYADCGLQEPTLVAFLRSGGSLLIKRIAIITVSGVVRDSSSAMSVSRRPR
jgi:hypothetical protein